MSKTDNKVSPLPLFDSMQHLQDSLSIVIKDNAYKTEDIQQAAAFLLAYKGSKGTFNSYRREIERLLHWSSLIAKKSLPELRRADIEAFLHFVQDPPHHWIGTQKPPRFIVEQGFRKQNPAWRPFVVTLSKSAHSKGQVPEVENFKLSHGAINETFVILSSFFNYLLQEEYVHMNPVALIRQKSKFIRKQQTQKQVRRLTELQWDYVINTAKKLAEIDPERHERTLFIMSSLYAMYLRISELGASERWVPMMQDFNRDGDGNWWFTTVGKGNKQRQIAVSDAMLESLKRWRHFLGLSKLPSPADNSELLPKTRGKGPIKSINYLRRVVQLCFDESIAQLNKDGFDEEAEALTEATVHWLRHTGISDDVKTRPREHVRDDAGHSSSATTDRYIDIELRERHRSAKNKQITEDDG